MMSYYFKNREEAGSLLAGVLDKFSSKRDCLILGLPRGGIVVAFEIARRLHLPLDFFMVSKINFPGYSTRNVGIITQGGVVILSDDIDQEKLPSGNNVQEIARAEQENLSNRESYLRMGSPSPSLAGKTVIVVDDGLATGDTMRAAVMVVAQQDPGRIIVAVPAGTADQCKDLSRMVDEIFCCIVLDKIPSLNKIYMNYPQVTDSQIRDLLERAQHDFN